MRKFLTLTAAVAFVAAFGFAAGPASAQSFQRADCSGDGSENCTVIKGAELQSDHALFSSAAGATAIYCGVKLDQFVEPWTLHVSASAPTVPGLVRITFNDADFIEFAVAGGSSFSTVQGLGGVPGVTDGVVGGPPGVDDVVKVSASGGVTLMMVSAKVRARATDPFEGDGETDNFCLTAPGDPGVPQCDDGEDNDSANGTDFPADAAGCISLFDPFEG